MDINTLYRILLVRFDYLTARCDLPIIVKWGFDIQAKKEYEFIERLVSELNQQLGITNVRISSNQIGTYDELEQIFDSIISNLNHQTSTSQLGYLNLSLRDFVELTDADVDEGVWQKFNFFDFKLPVRVIDRSTFVLNEKHILPVIIIDI